MFPSGGQGHGFAYVDWDYQDQNHNWSSGSQSPGVNNGDKGLRTAFVTPGIQYNIFNDWAVQIEVPVDFRSFTTLSNSGDRVDRGNWSQFGDIRLNLLYTGFFSDHSLGVSLGVKLPNGSFTESKPNIFIDRDSQLGTGSTDVLLSVFYHHWITNDRAWWWFSQINADIVAAYQDGYRPGSQLDQAIGVYYNGWSIGKAKIRPIATLVASERAHDHGPEASGGVLDGGGPVSSGYERILLSPGIEIDIHPIMIDFGVEFPVYQYVTGDQLIAKQLYKLGVTWRF